MMYSPVTTQAETPRSNTTSQGIFGLRIADGVVEKVKSGEMDRVDTPDPIGPDAQEGDLLRFPSRNEPDGVGLVVNRSEKTVELEWHFSDRHKETREREDLDHRVNYGRVEKVASNLSKNDMKFLVGEPLTEYPISDYKGDLESRARNVTTSDLTFTHEYKDEAIRKFLNHPSVGHKLGRNYNGSRGTFAARYNGNIVALVELTYPSAINLDGEKFIELKRYAAHPNRPPNTGSWLIAQSLEWAKLEGFSRCRSYAGVAENEGVLYKALEFFRSDGGKKTQADGSGWNKGKNRSGRSTWDDYDKARFDKQLLPESRIHRRTGNDYDGSESGPLAKFGGGITNSTPIVSEEDVSDLSLNAENDNLVYGRRDNDPELVDTVISEYGNQVKNQPVETLPLEENDTAVFCALANQGIAAALVVTKPDSDAKWEFGDLQVVAYAAQKTKFPNNTAATLLGKARKWAGFQGYKRITVEPDQGTILETAAKQAGFQEKPRTDEAQKAVAGA